MADKIKAIKIKQKNGTYSEEVPISVNVQNVQWDENNHTLLDALGSVDISSSGKGNLQHQIDELDGDKISTNQFNSRLNDFLKDQISADTTDWLDDNVNPVGSAVIVDKTLTIEGAAADALAVKTELNKKANASNTYTKAEVNAAIDAKQIEVDDTLSITGTAADAKAVGDELTAVKADLDDKVNIQQGVSYAGKALIVGDDGNVIPSDVESCFNANFIHAFINILKDVPYISGNAEQYIDDITNAMIGGDKRLVSITATYNPSQNEIHQYDNVESIRDYTTVTAHFNDGTTRNVTDFSMTGNFAEAQSVITIDYFDKTTQIIVNVTIDNHLMYYLTKGTELNGIHGIDTGIKLSDVDKDLTILADITDSRILQSLRSDQFLCDRNSSSGIASYQIYMPALEKSTGVYKKRYYVFGNSGSTVGGREFSNDIHRLKVGIRHYKDSGVCMIYLKVDDTVLNNMTNVNSTFRANDQTAFIGERPDGGYQWKGRVNLFNIYDYGLTMNQMKALLGEE